MNVFDKVRNRISDAVHDAEKAATDAAAKAKEAVTSTIDAAKDKARAVVSDPPAPSAASVEHAQAAAADAVRNSTPPANEKAQPKKERGVFVGHGAGAAAGVDAGVGGQVSTGVVIGTEGTVKRYASGGIVNGAMGASAGAGVEVGAVMDVNAFYGDGYQLSASVPGLPISGNLSFSRDDKSLTAVSVGIGKSVGGGIFHFETVTAGTSR